MPGRSLPFVTGEIYHVLNRGIDHRPTFLNQKEFQRGIEGIKYYLHLSPPVKFSHFLVLPEPSKKEIIESLHTKNKKLVEFISYCLMPNHFHFLLKQLVDKGISKFMSNFQNSYTRYFNSRHERKGPLFLNQFRAVRIETEEQLLHVSRYTHLNPFSSFLVKKLENLKDYQWSSLREYLDLEKDSFCDKFAVLSFFKSTQNFTNFVFDQADYQRKLEIIKHLTLET